MFIYLKTFNYRNFVLLDGGDLPSLLTRSEVSTRIAEEARQRRLNQRNTTRTHDTEKTVYNPPPSPVTDDPDHADHQQPPIIATRAGTSQQDARQLQDYSTDFLDINVDVNDMEVF